MAWVNPRDGLNVNVGEMNNIAERSFIQKRILLKFQIIIFISGSLVQSLCLSSEIIWIFPNCK